MLERLFGLEYQRKRLLKKASDCPLRDYLKHPFPNKQTDYRKVEYVAIDLETTGLDQRKDHILSVGLVVLRGFRIDLATAEHILLHTSRDIPEESAIIHQITDDQVARGSGIGAVMPRLLKLLAGRVMIAHHARVEAGFLSAACERLYRVKLPIPTVDTQAVALRWFRQRDKQVAAKELRLHALRERYNLPRYPAHNALTDALAAAELFLAQAAYRDQGRGMPLGEFLLIR
jgi:DNA polymerase-3 subunit epsilon